MRGRGGDFGPQHLGPVPPVRPGPDTDRLPPAQVRHHTHRHRHCGGAGRHCLHHRGGGDLHRHPGQPVRPRAGTPLPGEGSGGGRAGHRRLQPRHGHRPRPGAGGDGGGHERPCHRPLRPRHHYFGAVLRRAGETHESTRAPADGRGPLAHFIRRTAGRCIPGKARTWRQSASPTGRRPSGPLPCRGSAPHGSSSWP